jgi:hypothetical protein
VSPRARGLAAPSPDQWGLALSVLLAVGAYLASVGHDFVYDDVHVIAENPLFHSIANWRAILGSPWWGPELYRPVTALTLAVDWSVGGGDPKLFHAWNVVFHAVATGLVFVLARRWLATFGATVAAALFAVHPVHVEAVANVVGRAEVLAGLFTVAATIAYAADGELARSGDRSWRRWLTSLGSLGLLALALGSKESAFATPGIFLIVDWLEAKRAGERPVDRWRRHGILWLAAVALTAEFLWVRTLVVGELSGVHAAPGIEGEGLVGRLLVMAPVVLHYVRLLFFPLRLSADYSPNFLEPVPALTPEGAAGLATVLLGILLAIRARDRAPLVSFGLAWVGGTLLVIANILVPTGVVLAERSMYVPSVGVVLMLGWAAGSVTGKRRLAAALLAGLVVGLGMARTVTRVPVWSSRGGFFLRLVKDAPGSYRSFWVASALAYGAGNRDRGEALALEALKIHPVFPNLWEYMARRYEEDERWLEAAHALNAEFRLDSTRLRVAADAIVNYVRAGALDSAAAVGARAQRVAPHDYRVHVAMSDLALARDRPLEAMTYRRRVAWQFPGVWQYWHFTAAAALDAGYCPEVRRDVSRLRALEVDEQVVEDLEQRAEEVGCAPAG